MIYCAESKPEYVPPPKVIKIGDNKPIKVK